MTTTQDLYNDVLHFEQRALDAAEAARIATSLLIVAKRDAERAHARLTQAVRDDPGWVWPAFRGGDVT